MPYKKHTVENKMARNVHYIRIHHGLSTGANVAAHIELEENVVDRLNEERTHSVRR